MAVAPSSSTARSRVVVLDDAKPAQGLGELKGRLREALGAGDVTFVVDVSGLERLSSGVVAALLWTKRQGAARGLQVVVEGASPRHGLLTRTGLGAVLGVDQGQRR